MPFNILLLPLLGGFIFISQWNLTKWYAKRAEKERLLFYAAIAGFGWLAFAYFWKIVGAYLIPCYPDTFCFPVWWRDHIPFDHSGISVATFVLGALGWWPLNAMGVWSNENTKASLIQKEGTALEKLTAQSVQSSKHVLVSLKGSKVYVGRVVDTPEPAQRDPTLMLFPTLSGYRGNDDQMICWTLSYDEVYRDVLNGVLSTDEQEKILKEFRIAIPITELTSITLFSYEHYDKYFATITPRPA